MRGRRILILGGARFHGYRLAEYFSSIGDDVYVLNRGHYRKFYPFRVRHLKLDRNCPDALMDCLSGLEFDWVIDNNGYTPNQVNTLLRCIQNNAKKYLFVSSATVYFSLSSCHPLKENETIGYPCGYFDPEILSYAKNKSDAEKEVLRSANNLCYTIIRLPNIFGEGDFSGKLFRFYSLLKQGHIIEVEEEVSKFSLIYVNDVISAVAAVLSHMESENQIFNIADPSHYTLDTFFRNVFGELFTIESLKKMPSCEIRKSEFSPSFAWGPTLDTSLAATLLDPIQYTPIEAWGPKTLQWEIAKHDLNSEPNN